MSWFRRQAPEEQASQPKRRRGLNTYQRRALNSTLVHLERHLMNLEQLIQGPEQGILIHRVNPFSPATRQRLLELFSQLRQEIRATAAEYALPGAEEDIQSTVIGTCAILWSDLEDIRPATLNRYGAVDPMLDEPLGVRIEQLIQGALAIERLAKSARDSRQAESAGDAHQPPISK